MKKTKLKLSYTDRKGRMEDDSQNKLRKLSLSHVARVIIQANGNDLLEELIVRKP